MWLLDLGMIGFLGISEGGVLEDRRLHMGDGGDLYTIEEASDC